VNTQSIPGRADAGPGATGFLDPFELRRILIQFVTGVCAVSTRTGDAARPDHDAIAVNSFTSVSLDPPLVSMYLRADSSFLTRLRASGVWAVSFVGDRDQPLVTTLTRPSEQRPAIETAAAWETGAHTGCLLLAEGPGSLECALHLTQPLGDHVLVVGRVLSTAYRDEAPLVLYRGAFTAVASPG